MGKRDPRIDAYIAKAAPFAKPILEFARDAIHAGCPDVEETLKWSTPSFMYHGILCGVAAFKAHCMVRFWKSGLVFEGEKVSIPDRIDSLDQLPPKKDLIRLVKKAAALNEQGVKVAKPKRAPKPELKTPPDFAKALKKSVKANAAFEEFSPSHRREYIEWITGAKTDETRERRMQQAIEWIAAGKARNWKYERR